MISGAITKRIFNVKTIPHKNSAQYHLIYYFLVDKNWEYLHLAYV